MLICCRLGFHSENKPLGATCSKQAHTPLSILQVEGSETQLGLSKAKKRDPRFTPDPVHCQAHEDIEALCSQFDYGALAATKQFLLFSLMVSLQPQQCLGIPKTWFTSIYSYLLYHSLKLKN